VKVVVSRRMPSASPQQVWDVIADPNRHILTLPSSVSGAEVTDSGDIACVVSAMGKSERMVVRRVTLDEPRLLVEERIDGVREGRTVFEIQPEAGGSMVTLTAEVELPRLVAAVARGPIEQGLNRQLEQLEREATA
jgi:carbon monoxide dehydrogenase subunit G